MYFEGVILAIVSSLAIADACNVERKLNREKYGGYYSSYDADEKSCVSASMYKLWLNFLALMVMVATCFYNCCCTGIPEDSQQQQGKDDAETGALQH